MSSTTHVRVMYYPAHSRAAHLHAAGPLRPFEVQMVSVEFSLEQLHEVIPVAEVVHLAVHHYHVVILIARHGGRGRGGGSSSLLTAAAAATRERTHGLWPSMQRAARTKHGLLTLLVDAALMALRRSGRGAKAANRCLASTAAAVAAVLFPLHLLPLPLLVHLEDGPGEEDDGERMRDLVDVAHDNGTKQHTHAHIRKSATHSHSQTVLRVEI